LPQWLSEVEHRRLLTELDITKSLQSKISDDTQGLETGEGISRAKVGNCRVRLNCLNSLNPEEQSYTSYRASQDQR